MGDRMHVRQATISKLEAGEPVRGHSKRKLVSAAARVWGSAWWGHSLRNRCFDRR
ncbi:MAG: hypothetical protein WAN86_00525 [Hyphomicrobiaceae bacterium]